MTITSNRNVFLNCPFDEAYAPMLRATVFTVIDCGFCPRCALEKSDASEVRIQKIYRIIHECAYGIHDISRTQLDDKTNLPRFNMPLELGLFLGAKFLSAGAQRAKSCLVFDQYPHRYQMYLSDVAGQDIAWHSNEPREIVGRVRDWLSGVVDEHMPTAAFVWDHYATFIAELRHTCSHLKQRPNELTYSDLLRHIQEFRLAYAETLIIGSKEDPVKNPTLSDIKRAIRAVKPTDSKRTSYVILAKGASGYTYLQGLRETRGTWIVEYQDGHLEKHFRSNGKLNTDEVVECFIRYVEVTADWREAIKWTLYDTEQESLVDDGAARERPVKQLSRAKKRRRGSRSPSR